MSAANSVAPEEDKDSPGSTTITLENGESISEFTKVRLTCMLSTLIYLSIPFSNLPQNGLKMVVTANRCGSLLPSGAARDAYSAYPAYVKVIEHQSGKILTIIQDVLRSRNVRGNIARRDDDEKIEMLLECNDIMLESINSGLDEVAGIKKLPDSVVLVESEFRPAENRGRLSGSWNENAQLATLQKKAKLLTAKNILRPQLSFKTPVDNSNTPFAPRIRDKPHSIKPLAVLPEYDDAGNIESYLHPYEFELDKFEPTAELLCKVEVTHENNHSNRSMEETKFDFISTESQLKEMLAELQKAREIAVDLEHHSYRTFQGITCLMQVSTRDHDYLLDTIALRDDLHLLNEVFADPRIVKVLHGADSDVEWLQRDLGLYLVNLFDTHQAAKRLNFARLSLAYLLKHFCNVDADKSFQLADWRIRPLPQELITYARQDTHYLLHIYDRMRNDLLKAGNGESHLLRSVYQAGVELCKKRYVKPRLFEDSHMDVYRRSKKIFDNRQLYALQHLFSWRDEIGRMEDESTGYVLPNHMLMHIAEHLPREMQGILACCNPVPPLVRQHLHQLHQVLLKAREQPLVRKVQSAAEQGNSRSTGTAAGVTAAGMVNQLLYCPHDLTHEADFRDDLPTLLGSGSVNSVVNNVTLKRTHSAIDLMQSDEEEEGENKKLAKLKDIKFITPYSRFLSILPAAEEQERLENARVAEEAKKKKLCPTVAEVEIKEQQQGLKRKTEEENEAAVDVEEAKKQHKNPNRLFHKKRKWVSEQVQSFKEMMTTTGAAAGQSKDAGQETSNVTPKKQQNSKKISKAQKWKAKQCRFDSPQQGDNGGQSSRASNDFDYSSIDYTKFQGGSAQQAQQKGRGRQNNGQQFDSKFKTRGQKAKNADKKFNKMFSFSKVNHNKK